MCPPKHGSLIQQNELFRFEKFIFEVSALFVNIPYQEVYSLYQEVYSGIDSKLKKVRELFQLGRCGLLDWVWIQQNEDRMNVAS